MQIKKNKNRITTLTCNFTKNGENKYKTCAIYKGESLIFISKKDGYICYKVLLKINTDICNL